MADKFLRLSAVQARTGLSRSAIYEQMKREPPMFPKSIALGPRTTVWIEAEVDEWISKHIRSARKIEGHEDAHPVEH